MSARPVIIGIAGGTGSGKTSLARAIYDRVGPDRIEWISHDSYYRDFEGLSPEERHHINFDHPDSLETELLARHLGHLGIGRHGFQISHLGARPGQALHGVGDRLDLGVLLGQAHDLGPVGGRAHARLHLVEAVQNLVEAGLGEVQREAFQQSGPDP